MYADYKRAQKAEREVERVRAYWSKLAVKHDERADAAEAKLAAIRDLCDNAVAIPICTDRPLTVADHFVSVADLEKILNGGESCPVAKKQKHV